ncbi:uncharacterized protein LOC143995857 [Lithobates pipiens]
MISTFVSGKTLCLWTCLILIVFIPVWLIANCVYHPEDSGLLEGICGKAQTANAPPSLKYKRSIHPTEPPSGFTDRMLLLKFKYSYAQKSGFKKCWICSKLHPSTARIPLMAIPLNITPFLNGTPPIVLANVIRKSPKKPLSFQIVGRSHAPDWCFIMGNISRGAEVCKWSKLNVSMASLTDNSFFRTTDPVINATIYDLFNSSSHSPVTQLLALLTASGYSKGARTIVSQRPLALGNTTYICCGKLCYPWIPEEPQGWCYLAKIVPIMGVVGDNGQGHLLKASTHPRYPLKHHVKREMFLEKDMTWAWFPSWTGCGIDLMKKLNNYTSIIDEILEKDSEDITKLNLETRAIRKQLELHDLAIESMSAALTGLCEITEDYECCTWIHNTSIEIPDYYDIIAQHRKEVNKLQQDARDIGKTWDPFSTGFSLGGLTSWLKNTAMTIFTILLFILFLYACFMLLKCLCRKGSEARSETMKLTPISRDPTVWYESQEHEAGGYEFMRPKNRKVENDHFDNIEWSKGGL